MILTAYFDESGTHNADLSVMAGFIGDARQWKKFEKRAAKLFLRFRVDIFHTIDIKRTDKDFEGWKINKKLEFLDEFQHIINDTLERGFASVITSQDYNYYLKLPWSRKARRDSKYTILFRSSVAAAIDAAITVPRWANASEPRLHIVLESGHRNACDAMRLYSDIRERVGSDARALGGLTFGDKVGNLPLAAADLFAYSAYGQETGAKPIGIPAKPMKSAFSYRGNAYRVVIGRQTLDELHAQALSPDGGFVSQRKA